MAKSRGLTEPEIKAIKETMDKVRRLQPYGPSNRPHIPDQLEQSQDVYLARTQSSGLQPAVAGDISGTGSGSVSSSLWQSGLADTLPDALDPSQNCCQVYWVLDNKLQEAPFSPVCVWNMDYSWVPGDCWVWISRDKYGAWFLVSVLSPMAAWVKVHTLSKVEDLWWPGSQYTRDRVYIGEIWVDAVNGDEPSLEWYYWGYRRSNAAGRPVYTVRVGGEFMTSWQCLDDGPHNIYANGPTP